MNKHAQLLGKLGGKVKSAKKARASRLNGKKGGRPKGGVMKKIALGLLVFASLSNVFGGDFTRSIGNTDYKYNDDGSVEMGRWVGGVYYSNTIVDAPKPKQEYVPSQPAVSYGYSSDQKYDLQIAQLQAEIEALKSDLNSVVESLQITINNQLDMARQINHK